MREYQLRNNIMIIKLSGYKIDAEVVCKVKRGIDTIKA